MIFTLTINGEIDETKLALIASILAGGSVPTAVQVAQATVSSTPSNGTSEPSSAASVPPAEKPAKPAKAPKEPKPSVAGTPTAVQTEPPTGNNTLVHLKELIVARCAPDATKPLTIKGCVEIIRGLCPGVTITKIDDTPAAKIDECYEAILAA